MPSKTIRTSTGAVAIPSTSIEPFSNESCLKPIGSLAQTIQATSAGDMLLFMIALGKEEAKKDLTKT